MKKFILLFFGIAAMAMFSVKAQTTSITGTVISADDGSAIPGVSVVVEGTTLGTITNIDGKYSIDAPDNAERLVFSFIGMESVKKPIKGNEVNVVMDPDFIGVGEVMVLGYISKGKNEITGSTVQVGGEELEDIPVTSIDQALQGKVAGLNISASSGTPGSVQDIRIRGVGSITAGNEPLFVIDGVPVINSNFSGSSAQSSLSALASINSNDIESITVLKDASATSAYGARGSNGVIVITTKKGKMGETKFNVNATAGFQNNATNGLKPLTGAQRAELLQEAAYNTFGEAFDFTQEEAFDFMAGNLTSALKNWVDEGSREGNWGEVVKNKNALVQNYDVSASGGDAVSSFYASLGYNKTEATVIGGNFERISAKLNYNRNFSATVRFSTNITVSNTVQDTYLEQSAYFGNPHMARYFMSPWIQPYNEDGTLNTNLNTSIFNPLYTIANDIQQNDLTRGLANSFLEWNILDNLKFRTLWAVDFNLSAFHDYRNRIHGDYEDEGGSTTQSSTRNFNWVSQNSLDYDFESNGHNFAFKALMEFQKNKYNYLYAFGEKFPADGLFYIASAGANYDASSSFSDWKNLSYLGMMNYNYEQKYIADLTFRREGSSRFAPGLRFGNFWSVGAAWNISEEDFLSGVTYLDNLRIRGSYGISGSSAIGINEYQALLSYDANYADEGAIYPSQFGNADLTWEKNRNYDTGIEFDLFKGRIGGSFAYYNKDTYDLLQNVPISRTTGHSSITMNVGAMTNKGVEANLDLGMVRTNDFNFTLSANMATVNNRVTELAEDASGEEINIETERKKVAPGHPVYAWNMRKFSGVNPVNGNAQWYLNGEDGAVTENYYEAEKNWQGGSALPTLTGGLGFHVNFKGVFLNANFYYAGGHKVYEDLAFYTHHSGIYTTLYFNGVETMMDRWQEPGDVTDVPKVIYSVNDDSRPSTRFLYEGDYARLKDLVLGYNLPSNHTQQFGFDGITLTARATNLYTWVKDDRLKYDPEVRADGFTRLTTPPVKSVVFGVNLKF